MSELPYLRRIQALTGVSADPVTTRAILLLLREAHDDWISRGVCMTLEVCTPRVAAPCCQTPYLCGGPHRDCYPEGTSDGGGLYEYCTNLDPYGHVCGCSDDGQPECCESCCRAVCGD